MRDMGNERSRVRVSGKWLRHCFSCTPDYIRGVCHGRCCEGSGRILVSLLSDEQNRHKTRGFSVVGGRLVASDVGKCPHKQPDGFCDVHGGDEKPFGCVASPFTVNKSNMLIIRYRYTRLKCHGKGGGPAYRVFRASLDLLFGMEEAGRIVGEVEAGKNTIWAMMPSINLERVRYLDSIKHGNVD